MKLRLISDLHNEFEVLELEQQDEDILIAAGDIDLGTKGAEYLINNFDKIPIIYVCGNHEYYGYNYFELNKRFRELSLEFDNFHFLENDIFEIGKYRFLGCTLWTDFGLLANQAKSSIKALIKHKISDYREIKYNKNNNFRLIKPADTERLHYESKSFLLKYLSLEHGYTNIVVTHHPPSLQSIDPAFYNDPLNAAFASNLEALIKKYQPHFWLHGHTHYNIKYSLGKTKIITNQRGYPSIEDVKNFVENYQIRL